MTARRPPPLRWWRARARAPALAPALLPPVRGVPRKARTAAACHEDPTATQLPGSEHGHEQRTQMTLRIKLSHLVVGLALGAVLVGAGYALASSRSTIIRACVNSKT